MQKSETVTADTAPDMISQVQQYIRADWYIRRAARYDVREIAAVLAAKCPETPVAAIDPDVLWDVMDSHVICRHEPVAGMSAVDLEDLREIARHRWESRLGPIECYKCDARFSHDAQEWIIR